MQRDQLRHGRWLLNHHSLDPIGFAYTIISFAYTSTVSSGYNRVKLFARAAVDIFHKGHLGQSETGQKNYENSGLKCLVRKRRESKRPRPPAALSRNYLPRGRPDREGHGN